MNANDAGRNFLRICTWLPYMDMTAMTQLQSADVNTSDICPARHT